MQARFTVTMTVPSSFVCLFNMPPKPEEKQPSTGRFAYQGSKTVAFETSPPMSSYLLAWVVGELTSVATTIPGPTGDRPVAVWGGLNRWDGGRVGGGGRGEG